MKFAVRILTLLLFMVAISAVKVLAFESSMWPGEGRPVFVAKTELTLYERPLRSARVVPGLKIPKGQKMDYIQTVYRTTKSGWFKVLAFSPDVNISVVAEPQTEWWIEIANKQKNPIGWVLIDKKTVASSGREF